MSNQIMLVNNVLGEECRIAIVDENRLEELYVERNDSDSHVNNIYRGKVTNVEPSIQAAFIDFGLDRNGFLHISDLHPRYFPGEDGDTVERVGKKTARRDRPPIQECLKRGDEILVQVLKEGIGTKGPTLTSYLSLPGRFLVMMPQMERSGVSRKIESEEERQEMRKILSDLDIPEGLGVIVRTAGIGRTKTEIKRDFAYLMRLWENIEKRMAKGSGPVELYTESDLVIRTLRDVLSPDIKQIIIDEPKAAMRAAEFLRIAAPRGGRKVFYYDQATPLFEAFHIEDQIDSIFAREVPLPSGGSLVIDSTEALVAIDVNSGKNRDNADAEETAFRNNLEAVDEICRQLRLRDLGGLVVMDLIDMYMMRHRREVEKRMRDNLKKDRARTKVLKISELGLLEMTRQRMRPSLKKSTHAPCPTCNGAGLVKNPENAALHILRRATMVMTVDMVYRVQIEMGPKVAAAMINRMRRMISTLELTFNKVIDIQIDDSIEADHFTIQAFDRRGVRQDISRIPEPKIPDLKDLQLVASKTKVEDLEFLFDVKEEEEEKDENIEFVPVTDEDLIDDTPEESESSEDGGKKKKRRRRRRKSKNKSNQDNKDQQDGNQENSDNNESQSEEGEEKASKGKKKRRRRSRGRGKSKGNDNSENQEQVEARNQGDASDAAPSSDTSSTEKSDEEAKPKRKRSRKRLTKKRIDPSSYSAPVSSSKSASTDSKPAAVATGYSNPKAKEQPAVGSGYSNPARQSSEGE